MSVARLFTRIVGVRVVELHGKPLRLRGLAPRVGAPLEAAFRLPPARCASAPLEASGLRSGLVFLSTLPNVEKHACVDQIVHLEERVRREHPSAKIAHVAADEAIHWREIDRYHPEVDAAGYTLAGADPASLAAFVDAFGVGVEENRRVAHGLFALLDGRLLAAEIPRDQGRAPDVEGFLATVRAALSPGEGEADAP